MTARPSRRQILRSAAGAVATALLAACGGGSAPSVTPIGTIPLPATPTGNITGQTIAPPAVSPTSATSGSPVTSGSSAAPTIASATRASASSTAGGRTTGVSSATIPGTAAAAITPAAGAGGELLRLLAFVPDQPDIGRKSVTFADVAAVKERYGYGNIRSQDDLDKQGISVTDYFNVTGGCILSEFTGIQYLKQYRDQYGFDVFQVDREIQAGVPPERFSHMEGAFDANTVREKLLADKYTTADDNGISYFTKRDDLQISVQEDRLTLARLNRVVVNATRILAAPATAILAAALNAEAQKTRTLAADPAYRALAMALPTIVSAAAPVSITSDFVSRAAFPQTQNWGPLHPTALLAMAYSDMNKEQRTMHVALVYARSADAAADMPELEKRLRGYVSQRNSQPILPTSVTDVRTRIVTEGGRSVLIADLPLAASAPSKFWIDVLYNDTLFLVTDPRSLKNNG
ncbi:MAG: hypothetical protein ACYDAR_10225 [Thermomicrobiales bacterium]